MRVTCLQQTGAVEANGGHRWARPEMGSPGIRFLVAQCSRLGCFVAAWVLVCCLAGRATKGAELQRFAASEPHLGTTVEIVLYADSAERADRGFRAAFARIAELNGILSDYDLESELSRLAAKAPTSEAVVVSDDLFQVLNTARHWSVQSGGAFDVTVGPLTKLWRRARRRGELPAEIDLQEAKRSVGYEALRFDPAKRSVELLKPGMRIDLGGIAKGYVADEALAMLTELGMERALINAGGDLSATGPPPGKKGWRVGLAPLQPRDPPQQFIELSHGAVATSGDSWQSLEVGGKRYSHLLDPKTGYGLSYRGSVTVVAGDGMTADALASALSVLEVAAGLRLADATPGVAAQIARELDGKIEVHASARFPELLSRDAVRPSAPNASTRATP